LSATLRVWPFMPAVESSPKSRNRSHAGTGGQFAMAVGLVVIDLRGQSTERSRFGW
jgi:hypothetical protein